MGDAALLSPQPSGIALVEHIQSRGGMARYFRRFALALCAPIGFAALLGWVTPSATFGAVLLILAPFFYLARPRMDAWGLAAGLAFFIVAYVPAVNFALAGDWRHAFVMAALLGVMAIIERVLHIDAPGEAPMARAYDLPILAGWSFTGVLLSGVGGGDVTLFIVPFALALFHFDRLCAAGRRPWLALGIIVFALLLYAGFFWDRYGRLLIGAMLAMPFLLMMRYRVLTIRPTAILVGLLPLLWLAQWIRGDSMTARGLADSSISAPSLMTVQMMEALPVLPARWAAFWDQWLLFYFSWVPRGLWEEKPLGLGFTIVDELTGRRGVSDTHSLAPGLLGESLWLLGSQFWIGLLLQIGAVVLLGWLLRRLGSVQQVAAAIALALLPTLLWGGLASYGARVWLALLPLAIYALGWNFFMHRRGASA